MVRNEEDEEKELMCSGIIMKITGFESSTCISQSNKRNGAFEGFGFHCSSVL
jgi:hypothetical protein